MALEQHAVYWRDAKGDYKALTLSAPAGHDITHMAHDELKHRGVASFAIVAAEPLRVAKLEKRTFMHATGGSSSDFFQQRALHLEQRAQCEAAHLEQRVTEALGRVSKRSTPFMEYARRQQLAAIQAQREAEMAQLTDVIKADWEQQVAQGVEALHAKPLVPEVPWPFNVPGTWMDVEPPNNTPRGLMVVSAIGYRMGNRWAP